MSSYFFHYTCLLSIESPQLHSTLKITVCDVVLFPFIFVEWISKYNGYLTVLWFRIINLSWVQSELLEIQVVEKFKLGMQKVF